MRILLAEDTAELATVLQRALEHSKYAVDVVMTGTEALEYALTEVYDIVLLDILMPDTNGIDLGKKIRKTYFQK